MKYTILDWMSNDVFRGKTFPSFDDAEEYLSNFFDRSNMDYEEWRQEYYIEEIEA